MINIALLKLTKEMWEAIESGQKIHEVRKLNKDFIQEAHCINFIDERTSEYLGSVKVLNKEYVRRENIEKAIMHKPTKAFIKKYYFDQDWLIVFEVRVIGND